MNVDLDLARLHVDDSRDAGSSETAAGGDGRHHFSGLRIFGDHDAVERRAHHQVVEILCAHAHGAFRDLHFATQRFESCVERRCFRLRLIELQLAHEFVLAQLLSASQVALRLRDPHFDFVEILARSLELTLRKRVDRADRRVVEPRQQLAFLYGHAFLDQHFGNFAGDLRRDRSLTACDDISGCIQHRSAAAAAARR
jgi:hypothetical protein